MRRERYLWFSGESQRLFFARERERVRLPGHSACAATFGYGGMCVWCWWSLMCLSLACLEAPRGRRRLTRLKHSYILYLHIESAYRD